LPDLILIAGPNGAGKTTFAREYLTAGDRRFEFVNADEIERGLRAPSDVSAARIMLARIDELVGANVDFAIETTLANLTYAQKIPLWQKQGYRVSLIYIRLSSVDVSLARVRKRAEAGGHDIPVSVLRRRFGRSQEYFASVYKPLVDLWYEWDSHEGAFSLRGQGHGMNQKAEIERMQAAFKRAAEKATRGTREERSGRFEVRNEAPLTRGGAQTDKPRRGSNIKK
jgi:predicted ABC-type ATPase